MKKWTELQLQGEIEIRLKSGNPVNKISAELAEVSGWKKQDITGILKKVIKLRRVEKWTEEQLVAAIKQKLKDTESANKIAAELVELSGWKKRDLSKILQAIAETENPFTVAVESKSSIQASKSLAAFVEWQRNLASRPGSALYMVKRWGDPVMVAEGGLDVQLIQSSNFQAVGLYNKVTGFGAITNFIRTSHEDVMRLKAMQIEDDYVDKRKDWRRQKMNWLCKSKGTIYFAADKWQTAPFIHWGTLALGGNLVHVEGFETITVKVPGESSARPRRMARLKGFRPSDWSRPLDDLLAEGLVHRCFCAYKGNDFGDTPKGIVYSPFYSLLDWDFAGKARPDALYIPFEWLEAKQA